MTNLLCRMTSIGMILAADVFASACPTATLNVYTAASFTCMVNDEPVANFTFSVPVVSGGATALTASQIEVTPTFSASSYTFTFSSVPTNGFSVTSGQKVEYQINFTWNDPVVVRAEDGMDPPPSTAFAQLNTNLCLGALFSPSCSGTPASLNILDNSPTSTMVAGVSFAPVGIVDTQSLLTLDASSGGSVSITNFSESVFTPEPGSALLAAAGLLALSALALMRRRIQPTL